MMIIFYLLLILRVGRCTDDLIFETKSVGQDVTLSCARTKSVETSSLFWIRLVSGNLPEFFRGTFTFDYDGVNTTPRITTKQENETFLLHIHQAKLSDTGVYYCFRVNRLDVILLNGTFLRIGGPEPDITAVIQNRSSDPVHPGDSVTLQCSVLSDSEEKTCPEEQSVYWFRAGSDGSYPSVIYAQRNNSAGCEKSPEAHSPQKCVYSFSKNVSSSDAGTYYCAVATCGEILFGNGIELEVEVSALNMWDLQKANTVLILLFAALAMSLIVIAFLIYTIKMKTCDQSNAAVAATASGEHQGQQRNEDMLAYSAPTFTKRKTGRAERKNVKTAEGETVYTGVRTLMKD
ncbi:signal-regulatory protein beta-2-like isoform X1 [Cebidichthys violaceus]|uniref:signal-regulatory protein beta-2-like isoform X1 n=1 Tax=Cebidichthys violaceus TaxID=271503 RepID=UPI0035CBB6EB